MATITKLHLFFVFLFPDFTHQAVARTGYPMHAEKLFARLDNLNTEVSALVEGIRYFYWDVVQLIAWRDVPNCVLHKYGKYKEAMQRM